MRVLVSGASGFIGSALLPRLHQAGYAVTRLVRGAAPPQAQAVAWDPARGQLEASQFEGFDAVLHLAGEPLVGRRWTPEQKARIRESRVQGTQVLATALARLSRPPRALLCASAIGFYGDRQEERLREESAPGAGFLADVCQAWESAAAPAAQRGIRVVFLRIGIVLSPAGGALKLMLPPFRAGVGGRLGSGRQYMSWVALDDVLGAILHVLRTDAVRGPVNVVAPQPVTNAQFTKTLGRVLGRPTLLPVPAFAMRLGFGELADEVLLASARVEPSKLQASGYRFHFTRLEDALRALVGRG